MKKLLYLLIPVIIVSCRKSDSEITATVTVQDGWDTKYDTSRIPGNYVVEHVGDTVFAQKVPHMVTTYTVKPSTEEEFAYAWRRGSIWWMLLGIGIWTGIIWWFMNRNNSGDDKVGYMVPLLIGLFTGAIIVCSSLDWWAGQRETIDKPTYDWHIKTYGNLSHWWPTKQK